MPMEKNARVFNCHRCNVLVIICSHCDRGNIYCGSACSQAARVENHRRANAAYQSTIKGKIKHAERQRRYRKKQSTIKVTDHGSITEPPDGSLPSEPSEGSEHPVESLYCHFCGKQVPSYLRSGYLGRDSGLNLRRSFAWPQGP